LNRWPGRLAGVEAGGRPSRTWGATSLQDIRGHEPKLAPFSAKKMRLVRARSPPAFSIATTVFSKVAFSGLWAIAAISRRCSPIPCSKAGAKCSVLIASKRGYRKGRELSVNSGFSSVVGLSGGFGPAAAARVTPRHRAAGRMRVSEWEKDVAMAEEYHPGGRRFGMRTRFHLTSSRGRPRAEGGTIVVWW
jgi:hypothetical protein